MSGQDIDPLVAAVVGDITDLLAKLSEGEAAMAAFAESAPAIQFDIPGLGSVESAAAETAEQMAQAESAAAMSAQELAAAIGAPLAMTDEELAATIAETQALTASTQELIVAFEEESAVAEQAAIGLLSEGAAADEAGRQTEEAGAKASASGMNWMALGLALAAATAGPLALSSAVVGAGLLIADFGGEAKGDLQQVEGAFRGTAEAASQSFEPALQEITQSMSSTVRAIEPDMAQIFQDLNGPAQSFFSGLEGSIEQGMDAVVPAIEQLEPVIASVTSDLGPLLEGVARFGQEMAATFEAGGGSQELAQLAQEIGAVLPVLGELTGELGGGLLIDLRLATPLVQALADVFNALGPDGDAAVIALLATAKAVNALSGPANTLVDVFQTVKSVVSTEWAALMASIDSTTAAVALAADGAAADAAGTEMAVASAAAAAGYEQLTLAIEAESGAALDSVAANEAAGAALDAEALEALAAGAALGDVVAVVGPFLVGIAAIAVAAYEVVDHWSAVSGFFEQAGQDAYNWGSDIGEGIGRGFEDAWNFIVKPIEDSINGIKNMFTSGFGILSPSTVTREYGQYIGQGLALGIEDSSGLTHTAAAGMTAATLSGFGGIGAGGAAGGAAGFGGGVAPSSPAGGNGGNVTYNLEVNVTQPFGTPHDIADAVMEALQQLNLRNGTTMVAVAGGRT